KAWNSGINRGANIVKAGEVASPECVMQVKRPLPGQSAWKRSGDLTTYPVALLAFQYNSSTTDSTTSQLRPEDGWRSPSMPTTPTTPSAANNPLSTTNKISNHTESLVSSNNTSATDSSTTTTNTTNNLNKVNNCRNEAITNSATEGTTTTNGPKVEKQWVDIVTVPLMMAYITRYIFGTDKLRPQAFEVRGINGISTGVVHCEDAAMLSLWIKHITNNIIGLTNLQMKLYNSSFPASEHVLYMGWVCEGVLNQNLPWQNWKPKFIALKGTDIYMFDTPPSNVTKCNCELTSLKSVSRSENIVQRS
ncbi:Gamma-1-syntrophin, partial [Halocaridina rubra]